MKHVVTYAAIIFCSACGLADQDDADVAVPKPKPPESSPESAWSSIGVVYDFDSVSEYGVNLVDGNALSVFLPGVRAGDRIHVDVTGSPYAEHPEADVLCDLRVHATDGSAPETPISTGGSIAFALNVASQTPVTASGDHTVAADGTTRLRVLGRVTRPDRFCGLANAISVNAAAR